MKKIIALLLVVVLTATVAVGGTLAYLTDRDSKVNTFTVGDVSIRLDEEFTQGAGLVPGVKIEKEATITNTGKNDAWVWMTMAVPAALDDDEAEVGVGNPLHWNVPGVVWKGYGDTSWATAAKIQTAKDEGYITDAHIGENGLVKPECLWTVCQEDDKSEDIKIQRDVEIDGVKYNVYTFLYNGKLASGATTPVGLASVYLDASIDINTDGQWYSVNNGEATKIDWNSNTNGNPKVIVSAYAIQAEGFDTVKAAYDAYQKQWGDNGAEYEPVIPADPNATGSMPAAYTAVNKIWSDSTGSAKNSFVVKIYSGDTYMGSTSLNNVDGIIDGDVYVTWSIALDGESTDYWTMKWDVAPSISQQPTKAELWIDGTKVDEAAIQLNGPDNLNRITGAVVDANNNILRYVVGGNYTLQDGESYVALN